MKEKLPDVLSGEEWQAFISTFNTGCATGLRNAALFTLMHDAGLRTCEIVALQTSDIRQVEVNGGHVTQLTLKATKGDKHRNVYLSEEADRLLQAWLEKKKVHGLGQAKRVFTTLKGGKLAGSYLREVAARKGEEAGIAWRVHPHALRHTFATDLLEDTGDLALVQDALGHSKPETTRVYAKVRNGQLAEAMTRRKPETLDAETVKLAKALQALPEEQRAALAELIRPK